MFCMLARNNTNRKPHQCQLSTNPIAGNTVSGLPRNALSNPGMPSSVSSDGIPRSGLIRPRHSAAVITLGKTYGINSVMRNSNAPRFTGASRLAAINAIAMGTVRNIPSQMTLFRNA
jgi:hypothetical protein